MKYLLFLISFSVSLNVVRAQELAPGKTTEITFPGEGLPSTLHAMMTGEETIPTLTVRLPDNYDSTKTFPLLVYVPGFDGGLKGNIYNAETIAGPRGWIVATLPLFKKAVDKSEPGGGILIGFEDYPVISKAYDYMLGRLFDLIPNINRDRSAMVGFSNGALTIAVLISSLTTSSSSITSGTSALWITACST